MSAGLWLFLFTACSWVSQDDHERRTQEILTPDGDGYSVAEGDCDDGDGSVYPGAPEIVGDGVDQDCDGGDDCYVDSDGDGFGRDRVVHSEGLTCDGEGQAGVAGDCDDGDPSVHPGANEVVDNGRDDDCDGAESCYQDEDDDGYLDATGATLASADADCRDAHEGTSSDPGGDCDDADPDVHPDAEDPCGDGVDQDCDGGDTCRYEGSFGLDTWGIAIWGENDGDLAGTSISGAGDVDADGFDDLLIGAPGEGTAGDLAGAAYLLYGPLSNDRGLALADVKLLGDGVVDHAGGVVSGAGDVNHDGYGDLLVAALGDDDGGADAGAAYLLYGPLAFGASLADADVKLVGEHADDGAGTALARAGDVDGDGYDDVLVGACDNDEGGFGAGAAYLLYGPLGGRLNLASADVKLVGEEGGDAAGWSVAGAGDVDDDGYDDVLVGAPENDAGGNNAGAAYLIYGPVTADLDLSQADARLVGEQGGVYSGTSVAGAGDMDGDDHDDVATCTYGWGGTGDIAYLLAGPLHGEIDLGEADVKITNDLGSTFRSVAGAGDVDADGLADLLLGAPYSGVGVSSLLYGPLTTDRALSEADAAFRGESTSDGQGSGVAGAGDVDGDGLDDLLLSAPLADSWAGTTYLILAAQMR